MLKQKWQKKKKEIDRWNWNLKKNNKKIKKDKWQKSRDKNKRMNKNQ